MGRLAELHNQLCREDAPALAWSGDRLSTRYQGKLAGGEMAVWIARWIGQDVGYAWFQANRGEFSLKEVGYLPERRSTEAYAALIEAGIAWVRRKRWDGLRLHRG